MARKSKYGEYLPIDWIKLTQRIRGEGLSMREICNVLDYNTGFASFLSHCKSEGIIPDQPLARICELINASSEEFIIERKTTEESVHDYSWRPVTPTDMIISFSENEFGHIEILTRYFELERTTDLFHKLLAEEWKKYYRERLSINYEKTSREDLVKELINLKLKKEEENG